MKRYRLKGTEAAVLVVMLERELGGHSGTRLRDLEVSESTARKAVAGLERRGLAVQREGARPFVFELTDEGRRFGRETRRKRDLEAMRDE